MEDLREFIKTTIIEYLNENNQNMSEQEKQLFKLKSLIKEIITEEKKKADRCLKIARKKNPQTSAYRSGLVVKCRKGKIWKDLKEEEIDDLDEKTDFSKEKDKGLHGWFERQGEAGKSKGWVDCNTCKTVDGKKKCKSCGRKEGEKRAKYPACRPTPSDCSSKGKGKTWGKKSTE